MRTSFALLAFLLALLPAAAVAQVITVDLDGTKDAVTIQAGIDIAPAGAMLRINAGTYYESGIILDGKDLTILYGDGIPDIVSPSPGSGTGITLRNVTSGTWVFGLRFGSFDTAILVEDGSPDVNYCTIRDCATGIAVDGSSGTPDLSFNLVENFTTALEVRGGAGAIVSNHTLAEGGTGLNVSAGSVNFAKNIVYRCDTGISCAGGSLALDCNDLWENQADYAGCAQGATDFFEMPMFCYEADASPGPYYLHIDSPCWAANNLCGVSVGAFTSTYGCTGVAVDEASWGRIKRIYSE